MPRSNPNRARKQKALEYYNLLDSPLDNPSVVADIGIDNEQVYDSEMDPNPDHTEQINGLQADVEPIQVPDTDFETFCGYVDTDRSLGYTDATNNQNFVHVSDRPDSVSRYVKLLVSRFNAPKSSLPYIVRGLKAAYKAGQNQEDISFPSINSLIPRENKFLKESLKLCTKCDSILKDNLCQGCGRECNEPSFLSVGNLKAQFESLFKDSEFVDSIKLTKARIKDGQYETSEVYSGKNYKRIIPMLNELDITLALNTDGVDCFVTSAKNMWPIFLTVNELPYPSRFSLKYTILAGIFYGPKNLSPFKTFCHIYLIANWIFFEMV